MRRSPTIRSCFIALVATFLLGQMLSAVPAAAQQGPPQDPGPPKSLPIPELPPVDRELVPAPGGDYGDKDPKTTTLPDVAHGPGDPGPQSTETSTTERLDSSWEVSLMSLESENSPPAAAQLTSPANAATLETESPTLKINKPVTDPDGDRVHMNYQVATANTFSSTVMVVESGWSERDYAWYVPSGKLKDGKTYFWRVQTSDLICPPDKPNCGISQVTKVNSATRNFNLVLHKWGSDPRWAMWTTELGNGIGLEVNQGNGNLYLDYPLDSLATPAGPLDLRLEYNSQQSASIDFGDGWSLSAGPGNDPGSVPQTLTELETGELRIKLSDGNRLYFPHLVGNQYASVGGGAGVVTRSDDAPRWRYRTPSGSEYTFDSGGKLKSAVASTGDFSTPGFTYNYNASGRLVEVKDPLDRTVTITWDGSHPSGITNWDSRSWTIGAGTADRISSVTDPAGSTVGFTYNTSGNLSGVTDGEGHATAVTYPTSIRGQQAVGTVRLPGIAHPTSFSYGSILNGEIVQLTRVTDPRGVATTGDTGDFQTLTDFNVAGLPVRIEEPWVAQGVGRRVTTQLWDENLNLVCRRTPEANRLSTGCVNSASPSPDNRQYDYRYQNRAPHLLIEEKKPTPIPNGIETDRLTTTYAYDQGFDELYAEYFSNPNLAGRPVGAGFQQGTDMDFGSGSPDPLGAQTNDWSMRLTGTLEVLGSTDDRYHFRVTAAENDGVRLVVGNKQIFDCWEDAQNPACPDEDYKFPAGDKRFVLEFRDRGGMAEVAVLWKKNGPDYNVIPATDTQPEVNLLTTRADNAGATAYAYAPGDKVRRLVTSESRAGRTTSYEYDSFGRVTEETDPLGQPTTYEYTGACLTKEVDRTGATTEHDCNGAGDVTETRRMIRAVADQPSQTRTTRTTYDPLGRVETVSESIGGGFEQTVDNDYDLAGRLERTTDAIGGVTVFAYDPAGRLTQETLPDPDGDGPKTRAVIIHAYDMVGNETSTSDARGKVWTRTFDSHNRITTESDPFCALNGASHPTCSLTTTSYDTETRKVTTVDAAGVSGSETFDLLGRLVSKSKGVSLAEYEYNEQGFVSMKREGTGPEITYVYNAFGEVTQETRPHTGQQTSVSTFAYDGGGRLETSTDPLGFETLYTHDPEGRLTSVEQPITGPDTTTYVYDDAGELVRVTDPEGRQRDMTFDERGRQVEATDARGTTKYVYDRASRLLRTELPTGVTQIFEYDALGRRTRRYGTSASLPLPVPLPPGEIEDEETYGYDPAGNMTDAGNGNGSVSLVYDHAGRLSTVTAQGQTTTYAYEDDRLKSRTDAAGVTGFSYDLDGLLQTISDPFGNETLYEYDNLGRVTDRHAGPEGREVSTAYTYDAASRVDTQTSESVVVDLGYDKSSNVVSKSQTGPFAPGEAGTWFYSYDGANRLTTATDPGGTQATYGYDGAGNRASVQVGAATAVTTSYDGAGHPDSSSDGTDYTTDATGSLTQVSEGGVPPLPGEVTSYGYDSWGRLEEVTDPDLLTTTYEYDALDRTTGRTDALGEAAYRYAGDSHDMVFEEITLAGAGGVTSRKVALSPDGPLAIQSTDAVGSIATRYLLSDAHGDVVALYRHDNDLTGTRSYSPWGEARGATGDAAISPFGFQGDWTDPGTGQVDMGARMYEPGLGRFTSMDPLFGLTTNPLSLNRFTYGLDNPVTFHDPTGLCVTEMCASESADYCVRCYRESSEYQPGPSSLAQTTQREAQRRVSFTLTARRESRFMHCWWGCDTGAVQSDLLVDSLIVGVVTVGSAIVKSAVTVGLEAARSATKAVPGLVDDGVPQLRFTPRLVQGNVDEGLEHIAYKHWHSSGIGGASRFGKDIGLRDLKSFIQQAARTGTWETQGLSHVIDANLGRTIGTTLTGTGTSWIRVISGTRGQVVTAYPIPAP